MLIYRGRNLIVLTYIDNIPIIALRLEDVLWFKRELSKVFKIKDLGKPTKILRIKLTRDRPNRTLKLD